MIDRRRMVAAAAALVGGAGWAGAALPRPSARATLGKRNLEGTWTLGTYTELERPKELSNLVLTPGETEAYEAPRRALHGMPASKPGEVGQPESEFNERGDGLARVNGQVRSSWIVDPADGHMPYTPAAIGRLGLDKPPYPKFDNPEDRPVNERCLGNGAAGAPMLGGPDTNLFLVVQTKDNVAILTEKYHDVRIVRLGSGPRPHPLPPSWLGDSVGHWEGDTLVVETVGLRPGMTGRGQRLFLTDASRVVERFTRTGPSELFYEFTVEDPTLFTRPWRCEMSLQPAPGRIFEDACHEGNYSMSGILAGARTEEKAAAATAGR